MVLELVGSTYIVCLMNQAFVEVVKLFLEIMCVNIGGIQNKMDRLTRWNERTEQAELKDWDEDEWRGFISDFDCGIWFSLYSAIDKLAEYEDLEEQGEFKRVVHGHWVLLDDCSNEGVYCSECHKKVYKKDYNYANVKLKSKCCPNCGAIMDGEFEKL